MSTIGNRTYIWLSKCTCVQISNITKVCVQNVLHESVCSNARSKTWTPLPDRCTGVHRWTPGGNQAWLQLVNIMHPAAMLPPRLVVYWVQVRTVGWLQSWSDEVCVSQVNSSTVSRALWVGALSCLKVKKSPDRSRMAGRSCWWSKTSR